MWISNYAIKKPIITTVTMIALVVFGGIAMLKLHTDEYPDVVASVLVVFTFEKDIQQASQDIREKISESRADLPVEIEEPVLSRFSSTDFPIVSLTLTGTKDMPTVKLTQLAELSIKRELTALAGVASVDVVG